MAAAAAAATAQAPCVGVTGALLKRMKIIMVRLEAVSQVKMWFDYRPV